MPAPTQAAIEDNLKNALLSQGFVKYAYVDGVLTAVPGELPPDMKPLVMALAAAMAKTWTDWQARQAVLIPTTSVAGTPSVGSPLSVPPGGLLP